MFKTIVRAGAAAAGLTDPTKESTEKKIARLAVEVSQRMKATELSNRDNNETCIGLYCNFFLSIFALAESAVRLVVHLLVVPVFFFGFYIILCLSCGKAESGNVMRHQMSRISMYSGLVAAMLGNILIPWRPTLYLFHTPATLSRPSVPRMAEEKGVPSSLDIENFCVEACCCICNICGCKNGQCVCCGFVDESVLPPYKMAQSALFVVGGCSGCGFYQCTGGTALTRRLDALVSESARESAEATTQFYRANYNVASWDALVASRFGASRQSGPPQQQYMQQHQVPAAQVHYSQQVQPPVVIAQPVYNSK